MPPTSLMSLQDWEALALQSGFQPALMAARCPLSLRQLERCFAAQFGKTPRQWTRELRCRLACPLVIQGWSNRAVAIELGFADEAHFCHEFKRVYGVSPQKFARANGAPPPRSGPPVPCQVLGIAGDADVVFGQERVVAHGPGRRSLSLEVPQPSA